MMFNRFIFTFISSLFIASAGLALTGQEAQQCVSSALKTARHNMSASLDKHLDVHLTAKKAYADWNRLSSTGQAQMTSLARQLMLEGLQPFRFGLWLASVQIETIAYRGAISHVTGRVTVAFLVQRPFKADIAGDCRLQSITMLTKDDGWQSLDWWLNQQPGWPSTNNYN